MKQSVKEESEVKIRKYPGNLFLILIFLLPVLLLTACREKEGEYKGKVTMWQGGESGIEVFGITDTKGVKQGFIVTENTKLVWTGDVLKKCGGTKEEWDVFGPELYVSISPGREMENPEEKFEEEFTSWREAKEIRVTGVDDAYFVKDEKPVIYLYPKEETEVEVILETEGRLTCTYPLYQNGWKVKAAPNGLLTDAAGQTYNYLYWEGVSNMRYDFSEGFCVAGKDTALFLEESLARLGLTRKEANEFIVYWLPRMQENPYNLISFQKEEKIFDRKKFLLYSLIVK